MRVLLIMSLNNIMLSIISKMSFDKIFDLTAEVYFYFTIKY